MSHFIDIFNIEIEFECIYLTVDDVYQWINTLNELKISFYSFYDIKTI